MPSASACLSTRARVYRALDTPGQRRGARCGASRRASGSGNCFLEEHPEAEGAHCSKSVAERSTPDVHRSGTVRAGSEPAVTGELPPAPSATTKPLSPGSRLPPSTHGGIALHSRLADKRLGQHPDLQPHALNGTRFAQHELDLRIARPDAGNNFGIRE